MSDHIPYEIQLEIINRVPDVKSLFRLRSVSKPWKSYIDSSEFISGYGVRDTQPPRFLLRYKEPVELPRIKYVSLTDDVTFPQQKRLNFAPNVALLVKELKHVTVIGSSCGLWCLHGVQGFNRSITGMIVIWNPSIRKAVGIVVPSELNNVFGKITQFGFGVCPSTYDPTIVGITRSFQGKFKHFNYKITWQVTIFTLSSKTWEVIPTSNIPRGSIRLSRSTPVAIDRFIFWVAYDDPSSWKSLILSFDLINHEFKEVNLPDSIANRDVFICKLRESLVVSTTEVDERIYAVWMMGEEGGAMTSFTKLFAINTPDLCVKIVLGYKKSGEPIIETEKVASGFTKIKVYDPSSGHINDLGITGVEGSFFISPYSETLLLADHLDGCIIPNNY